jgi:hypothetical protein
MTFYLFFILIRNGLLSFFWSSFLIPQTLHLLVIKKVQDTIQGMRPKQEHKRSLLEQEQQGIIFIAEETVKKPIRPQEVNRPLQPHQN